MCHINVTAVILQEISQFVVNINMLGGEDFVKVENRLVVFSLKKDGFGSWAGATGFVQRQSCLSPKLPFYVPGAEVWARLWLWVPLPPATVPAPSRGGGRPGLAGRVQVGAACAHGV